MFECPSGHVLARSTLVVVLAATIVAAAMSSDHRNEDRRQRSPVIEESFATLEAWDDLVFDDIERLTNYSIEEEDDRSLLFIESIDGGSGIVHAETFDVYDNPVIEWSWRVEDIISSGDLTTREGDTYPVRVYVNFEYDPDEVGFGTRLQYAAIRMIHGEYPPLGSLLYIWSNQQWEMQWYESPYTSRALMLPVDQGRNNLMEWREHRRNIVDDYRDAFGEDPPSTAQLAIMGDSYGSGETSRAWIDYVRVRAE